MSDRPAMDGRSPAPEDLLLLRGGDSGRILFVDDEQNVLSAVERLFRHIEITIWTASSALEALAFFENGEIAVIVSDNLMPGMKGVELLAKVKDKSPDTVRILMTAYADLETAIEAINQGEVFRFIIKPWVDDKLVDTVKEGLARHYIIKSLKRSDESTYRSLAQTIELKDPYTKGHCDRVAAYALLIAEALDFKEETKLFVKYGSWLHDCGKIGVPGAILNKAGRLDKEEFAIIKKHPGWGLDVGRQAMLHSVILNIIHYHHEKFGGLGYPTGIKGEDIPIEARIVAVADVYDALVTDRPYRNGFSVEKAKGIMLSMKGEHLDPDLVDLFFTLQAGNSIY